MYYLFSWKDISKSDISKVLIFFVCCLLGSFKNKWHFLTFLCLSPVWCDTFLYKIIIYGFYFIRDIVKELRTNFKSLSLLPNNSFYFQSRISELKNEKKCPVTYSRTLSPISVTYVLNGPFGKILQSFWSGVL